MGSACMSGITSCFLKRLLNILLVIGVCRGWNNPEINQSHVTGSKNSTIFIETRHGVYEYVGKRLTQMKAEKYCEYKFASLLSDTPTTEKLNSNLVKFPVWLKKGNRKSNDHTLTTLAFEERTDRKYAKLLERFPYFSEITVCAFIQWDNSNKDFATLFSYATLNFTNEFQLRGTNDEDGSVRFAVIIHGQHSPYLFIFPNDSKWHHFCVTWQRSNGSIALYADGKLKSSFKLAAVEDIINDGVFIIGQDQDSYGGTFTKEESFSGNITDLNIWAKVLSQEQIEKVFHCSQLEEGIVFGWRTHKIEVEPSLKQIRTESLCTGESTQCPILKTSDGDTDYRSCTEEIAFICHYTHDTYKQLSNAKNSSKDQTFANTVNMFANRTLISENIFSNEYNLVNVSEALVYLEAVEKGLGMNGSSVNTLDVLNIIQLLKEVSDMDMDSTEDNIETLSNHFVYVTGELLDQDNPDVWSEVEPVIQGPMTIIQTVEKMASKLVSCLSDENTNIIIHHKNLEVSVTKADDNAEKQVYKAQSTNRIDQIEVPGSELKRITREGHMDVAVMNTWFNPNSFNRLFGDHSHIIGNDDQASDGIYKHVDTYLASAVISSTILSGNKELSASVQYYLWHNNVIPNDSLKLHQVPVCVFWDFTIGSNYKGGWSNAGCTIKNVLPDATICFCNHTTNFAVLLQVYDVQRSTDEEWILRTLTFIGCGVSLCALVVTFILFLVVGIPKSERTTVHKNLIFALAAAEGLLMFSEMAKENEAVCIVVTACLHLFFMAAFAWMLVEGLLLWSKVVAVNMSEDRRMKFYYITGWGLPFIIVSLTLATSFNKYMADNHCWLNVQTDIIWAFVGPVLFILTVNTFVLFRVVMVTVSSARRRAKMMTPNCSLEKQIGIQVWATAKPIIVLLPVLGLTWLCGILVHLSIIWAYVFIFLNSFQGLYIFLIYAIYNSEVRNAIQRMKEKKKALSFTNFSQPTNDLSSPKNTMWETGKENFTHPKSSISDDPRRNTLSSGNIVAKQPVNIFSILSTENRTTVELTSFKTSGCAMISNNLTKGMMEMKANGRIL